MFSSYVQVLTNNIDITMKLVHFLALFLSGISMYFLSKRITNSKIGLVSAIIYMLFPYHLSDIYVRDALGECFLFIFLPLILSGIYELFNGSKKKFYILFILGYVGGMASHLVMMVYFTALLVIFLCFKFKDTIKNIKHFVIASLFILLIASPFLITMLEHKFMGNYAVFAPLVMSQGIQWGGLILYDYLGGISSDGVKFFMDIVVLILLVITIVRYNKLKNKNYNYIIIFLGLTIFLSTKVFPWDLLPQSFRIIQFPWRFEIFVGLLLSLFAPLCLNLFKDKIIYIPIILMVILGLNNTEFANDNVLDLNNMWYPLGMGWQKEYLPYSTWNNIEYFDSRSQDIIIKSGNGTISNVINDVPNLTFTVDGDVVVELPRLYYLVYSLESNNEKYEYYENEYGFIETKLSSGTYELSYKKTKLENICTFLAFSSIIVLVIYVRRSYEKN